MSENLPEGWMHTIVQNACNIVNNSRKPIGENERIKILGDYPYYGPTGILGNINEYSFDGTYALIGEDGDHFFKYKEKKMTQLVTGKFNVNNHAHVLSGTNACSPEWFYIYFMHKDITSNITRQGAKRYKLTKEALCKLHIIIPTMQEQQKIYTVLSTWDDAIHCTQNVLANSKKQKKALMQQLFTCKKRLTKRTGKWESTPLRKILREETKRNSHKDTSLVLSVTNHSGFVIQEEQFSKRIASKNISSYKVVEKGQFAYNPSRINVGSFARLDAFDQGIVSPLYIVFSIHEDHLLDTDFFMHWMQSDIAAQRIALSTQGSVRDSVSFDALCRLELLLPPLPEQKAIADVLTAADAVIQQYEAKLANLQAQKKALMQQLLTGKIRVKTDTDAAQHQLA